MNFPCLYSEFCSYDEETMLKSAPISGSKKSNMSLFIIDPQYFLQTFPVVGSHTFSAFAIQTTAIFNSSLQHS
jgi:hypothetical protein